MARCTATTVKAAYGGAYPTGWNSTTVGTKCTEADSHIDSFTYPETISTSGSKEQEIAHDVVFRLIRRADMLMRSSGTESGEGFVYPDLEILTPEIKERIRNCLRNSSYYGMYVIDTMKTSLLDE